MEESECIMEDPQPKNTVVSSSPRLDHGIVSGSLSPVESSEASLPNEADQRFAMIPQPNEEQQRYSLKVSLTLGQCLTRLCLEDIYPENTI